MIVWVIVLAVFASALAGLAGWLAASKRRLAERAEAAESAAGEAGESARSALEEARSAEVEVARLRERLGSAEERERAEAEKLKAMETQFRDAFDALAGKALKGSSEEFLKLAKQSFEAERERARAELDQRRDAVDKLVKPMSETLTKTQERLEKLAEERVAHHAKVTEMFAGAAEASASLRTETAKLVSALSKPQVRGRYGEIQLRRVVEIAGMRDYCDFTEQANLSDSEGARLRPDLIVSLPNDRRIAVDAKTNTQEYMAAIEALGPDEAEAHLARFASHVSEQAKALAKKEYAEAAGSPEFVVMFVPGDQLVDAALEREPALLERAAVDGVIIASPSTLIGLLRAVHVGWREQQLSERADELFALGKELHDRASVALGHAAKVGEAISAAGKKYNEFVGSVDTRLMPTIRRFEEAGAKSGKTIPETKRTEVVTREIASLPAPEVKAELEAGLEAGLESEPGEQGRLLG